MTAEASQHPFPPERHANYLHQGLQPLTCFSILLKAPDHCYKAMEWSREVGIIKHPDWYPNLTTEAPMRDIQDRGKLSFGG